MSFVSSFVIWVLTGGMVGWLVARNGGHPTAVRSVMIGIASGLVGGLLWFPWFSSAEVRPGWIYLFDLLSCNIFAGIFGSDLVFLVLEWRRDRRSDASSQK
ncbi:MAG TPA: hypothetical protein VGS07_09080 [Thermoanaerobaculia bacterium]|nr:hypothetical protein [Thermoanaerobaculia bacterium]